MALTNEQKQALIKTRVNEFEVQLFQHRLNHRVAVRIGNLEAAAQSEAAIAQVEACIDEHHKALAEITDTLGAADDHAPTPEG